MIFNFDTLIERRNTDSIKWSLFADDVIPMWVADMDFASPDPVIRALHERIDQGTFGYPNTKKLLYEAVQSRWAERHNHHFPLESIVLTPSLVVALNMICRLAASPGESVIVQSPVYGPFFSAPANQKLSVQAVTLDPGDHRYEIDFDRFEAAITPETRIFILCNPHNPSGRVFERWELEKLAEISLRHNLIIAADEIHCDLIYPGHKYIPFASLSPEVSAQTVTMISPSKTYNVPGLGCGIMITENADLLAKIRKESMSGNLPFVGALGQVAALAAYKDGQPWLDALMEYLRGNRDHVVNTLAERMPDLKMRAPEGTYLAWIDCRSAGIEGSPFEFFLNEARVALGNGKDFGPGGEGFVRMTYACPRPLLDEALDRMATALGVSDL